MYEGGQHGVDVLQARRKKIIYLGLIATVVIISVYAIAVSITAGTASSSSGSLTTRYTGVQSGGPMVGRKVPLFTLGTVKDPSTQLSLKSYIGKPIVLNFFASWCIPCKTELPEFASLAKVESGKVQFIGVDENDTRGPGNAIIHSTGVSYPTVFDGNTTLVQSFHLIGLPTTLFINSKGVVVKYIAGQISPAVLKQGVAEIAHS